MDITAVIKDSFAHHLREFMEEKCINQIQLAKLLGVRQAQVSNWLNKKCLPSSFSASIMSDILGIPFDELIGKN